MELAEVTPVFPPNYRGGQGAVAHENARMAVHAGISTTVYTPLYHGNGGNHFEEKKEGYHVMRLRPLFCYGNAAILPQLFWKLRKADVIHLHYPALGLELPVIFWGLRGKKVIMMYHMDLIGRSPIFQFIFWIYNRTLLPLLLYSVDTLCVSSFDYSDASPILKSFHSLIAKKIVELPNSVDTNYFFPKNEKNDRVQKIQGRPYILFVGALDRAHYFKGVSVLIEAFALVLKKNGDDCMLVIVGSGDQKKKYERSVFERGIMNNILFTGSVDHDALLAWIGSARCLVLPSTDCTEAFGVVLLEAGACGIPVIASDLPGVRSVVKNGITGLLVQPNNPDALAQKIIDMIANPEKAQQMGDAGKAHIKAHYSNDGVAKKFISLLRGRG